MLAMADITSETRRILRLSSKKLALIESTKVIAIYCEKLSICKDVLHNYEEMFGRQRSGPILVWEYISSMRLCMFRILENARPLSKPVQRVGAGKAYAHLFDIKRIQGWTVIRVPTSDGEEPPVNRAWMPFFEVYPNS